MNTITIVSLSIGLMGLVATGIGTYLTYISYVNPIIRFNRFLKKPKKWEKFEGVDFSKDVYRCKKYPNFQIIIDWNKEVSDNFTEEWMSFYPDNENNASYHVKFEVNGMLLDKELFVSLDAHRYFVPVPRIKRDGDKKSYFYDKKQINISNIIGRYHSNEKNINEFVKNQKKLTIEDMPSSFLKLKLRQLRYFCFK